MSRKNPLGNLPRPLRMPRHHKYYDFGENGEQDSPRRYCRYEPEEEVEYEPLISSDWIMGGCVIVMFFVAAFWFISTL